MESCNRLQLVYGTIDDGRPFPARSNTRRWLCRRHRAVYTHVTTVSSIHVPGTVCMIYQVPGIIYRQIDVTYPPLTGHSTYRIHLINGYISLHSCQILAPSETGFIVSAHRLTNITLLTLIATL